MYMQIIANNGMGGLRRLKHGRDLAWAWPSLRRRFACQLVAPFLGLEDAALGIAEVAPAAAGLLVP